MISQWSLLLLFLSLFFIQTLSQKAIVISSSIGYYNYRQTANALSVYHKLKEYGFSDDDIILMIPQNTGCCQKNPIYGSVSFIDNDYTNINKDIEIDFDFSDMNLNRVFDVMRGKYHQWDLHKVKFSRNSLPQSLFIYITGHGGNSYFKIRQRQAIIMEHFKSLFQDLQLTQRFSKILLMTDSCSAITPFQSVDIQNFVALGSSSFDQKSQSHGYDKLLNSPKSDDFTFYLMQYLEKNDPRYINISLKQLYNYMSFDKLKVHAKVVGKGKNKIKFINDFIVKKKSPIQKKKFRLQNILHQN